MRMTQVSHGIVLLSASVFPMSYEQAIGFKQLYKGLKKSCKNVRWKDSVVGYEVNAMRNTHRLRQSLLNGTYKIDPYQRFKVHEPKERDIVATRIKDRQFQRSLCDNGFYEQITRGFITDNCACLIGRGVDYTLNRLTCHLRRYRQKHGNQGWVLKCDIHHYFESINHEVACRAIRKCVADTQIADRVCEVVNSFGEIRGIGLGSQISQLVALSVLNDLDHFIKERLRIKHYIRYMDDFVLIHPDKEYLQYCLTEIEREVNKIGLFLHPNKTKISPLSQGVKLLQWRFLITDSGKIVRRMGKNKMGRQRRKMRKIYVKEKAGIYSRGTTAGSLASWLVNAKRGDTWYNRVKMVQFIKRLEESHNE